MNLTLAISDELARKLAIADGGDLERRALEAFASEEYRSGRLTLPDLRKMLGFETRYALDGFLKAKGIYLDYASDDLQQEQHDPARLGFYG